MKAPTLGRCAGKEISAQHIDTDTTVCMVAVWGKWACIFYLRLPSCRKLSAISCCAKPRLVNRRLEAIEIAEGTRIA